MAHPFFECAPLRLWMQADVTACDRFVATDLGAHLVGEVGAFSDFVMEGRAAALTRLYAFHHRRSLGWERGLL